MRDVNEGEHLSRKGPFKIAWHLYGNFYDIRACESIRRPIDQRANVSFSEKV